MAELRSVKKSRRSFWRRPEGVTGTLFLAGMILLGGWAAVTILPPLSVILSSVLYLGISIAVIGVILYMVLDPRMRNLVWYMYKSMMRSVTGLFIQLDPIGILKNYISDLENNLKKMSHQIGNIRGQMRKLKNLIIDNENEIKENLQIAQRAKEKDDQKTMLLSSRKAARLRESNQKYAALHKKMSVIYKVLTRMYTNSEILLEDTKDQVKVKEEEYKAIKASHSAMKNAMDVIKGDPNKKEMFDRTLEHIADDLANKVGEMEQFMEMSSEVMNSVDLQNGILEDKGLQMLEEWEKKSEIMLLGDGVPAFGEDTLDLNEERPEREYATPSKSKKSQDSSSYENLFD